MCVAGQPHSQENSSVMEGCLGHIPRLPVIAMPHHLAPDCARKAENDLLTCKVSVLP
jgi:hypothetical protein